MNTTNDGTDVGSTEWRAELDEKLSALTDQRGSVEPIGPAEHAERRARLGRLLSEGGYDAMLVEPGATMCYLSGLCWGLSERLFALVVLADGTHFWTCPGFERARVQLEVGAADGPGGEVLAWQEHEHGYAGLAEALRAARAARLAVEPATRYFVVTGLAEAMGTPPGDSARGIVTELRGRKDDHELAIMCRANELTQAAIVAAAEWIEPGMTGAEIGAIVEHAHRRLGLTEHWDLSLIGPAAAYPHGENRNLALTRGEVLLVDTGGALHGYQSDCTRTWVFDGAPSERVEKVWNAVRDAERAAFEAIRPGVRAGEIDLIARRLLEAHGLTEGYSTFTHRLGHGIGLEGHEDPYFDSGSEVTLATGMTLSDEPGIYLTGEFGVRIEDIVAVTADGAEHFGDWQQAPTSPA